MSKAFLRDKKARKKVHSGDVGLDLLTNFKDRLLGPLLIIFIQTLINLEESSKQT